MSDTPTICNVCDKAIRLHVPRYDAGMPNMRQLRSPIDWIAMWERLVRIVRALCRDTKVSASTVDDANLVPEFLSNTLAKETFYFGNLMNSELSGTHEF